MLYPYTEQKRFQFLTISIAPLGIQRPWYNHINHHRLSIIIIHCLYLLDVADMTREIFGRIFGVCLKHTFLLLLLHEV